MHFVLLSVLCSVTVAVILKYARLRSIETTQMIVWNYPAAVSLTYLFFKPNLLAIDYVDLPWYLYIPVAFILPSLFIILSLSLKYAGLVQTEVAQRISLVISLLAAFFLFQETFSLLRLLGILLGFVSIACLIGWQKGGSNSAFSGKIIYPLIVFFGYGAMDVLFKMVALYRAVPYTTAMFLMFSGALLISFTYLTYLVMTKKIILSIQSAGLGLLLGLFNFGNILFYMRAHQALSENPSIVFTGMNIGVIALGALVGVFFFKERLTVLNKIGLIVALVSVMLIYML